MSRYLPYHKESVIFAKELTKDVKSEYEKYKIITDWVSRVIHYDFIRAIKIPKKNAYPDVAGCWDKKMGICMDISALTVGMLKAAGVKAVMCYGHADRQYHAWVEADISGKKYRFDHGGKAKAYKTERIFKS